jgi:NADH-quinone oxidoreductase subunit I
MTLQLTNRAQIVSKKKMTWMEKLYIPAILQGLMITFKHMFRKSVTIKYPEQKRTFSPVYRGLHVLKRDEAGAERCTACGLCAVACPAEAIVMDSAERKPGEEQLYREEKYASRYEINMLRCIFCGLCEEACPKEAIFLTNRTVDSDCDRNVFVYGKDKLVEPLDSEKRIDVSGRQTKEVKEFKTNKQFQHNQIFDPNAVPENPPSQSQH